MQFNNIKRKCPMQDWSTLFFTFRSNIYYYTLKNNSSCLLI